MLSRFAPPGHRRISGEDPPGKVIYEDKLRNYGVEDNFPNDENVKGRLAADAMLAASCRLLLDRAKAEQHPLSAQTFLPVHEAENGIVPLPGESLRERRRRLYITKRLVLDGRYSSIHAALRELLGDLLVFYRATRVAELSAYDKQQHGIHGIQRRYNPQPTDIPFRLVRLNVPVARTNRLITVPCTYVAGDPEVFTAGQDVMVQGGSNARHELARVWSCTDSTLTLDFRFPHDAGTLVHSGHHPRYETVKRVHHIVLRDGASEDLSIRTRINFLMRRMVKGTATWQIMAETTPHAAGPFILGSSKLGITPFTQVQA